MSCPTSWPSFSLCFRMEARPLASTIQRARISLPDGALEGGAYHAVLGVPDPIGNLEAFKVVFNDAGVGIEEAFYIAANDQQIGFG